MNTNIDLPQLYREVIELRTGQKYLKEDNVRIVKYFTRYIIVLIVLLVFSMIENALLHVLIRMMP